MGQTIPTYITYLNQFLKAAKKQEYAQPLVTFKNMIEEIYFDSKNIPYNMYKEKYKWKVPVKKRIDIYVK